jgi:hypothetical protein
LHYRSFYNHSRNFAWANFKFWRICKKYLRELNECLILNLRKNSYPRNIPILWSHKLFDSVALKCIWHEISYFLKWKNSLSCSITYFSVSRFYDLFPRYFNLFDMYMSVNMPLIYDVTLVASSSKWLNITAIIQDDNFKLHSLVNVMKHWRKTWTDINSF